MFCRGGGIGSKASYRVPGSIIIWLELAPQLGWDAKIT